MAAVFITRRLDKSASLNLSYEGEKPPNRLFSDPQLLPYTIYLLACLTHYTLVETEWISLLKRNGRDSQLLPLGWGPY